MPLHSNHALVKAHVAVTISLCKKSDLLRFQTGNVNERIDHRGRLLGGAGTKINDVAIRGVISQDRSPRKRSEKQRFLLVRHGHGDDCGGASDIANNGEHIIVFDQLPHIGSRSRRFIPVIQRY